MRSPLKKSAARAATALLSPLSRLELVGDRGPWAVAHGYLLSPLSRLGKQRCWNPISLDSDTLVAEIKRQRGKANPLSAAALKALRDEDARPLAPARLLAAEALTLEHELSDLVNAAYGLTPAEIELMWDAAPPRMPTARPPSAM